jgi:hypothetical protein
MHTHSPPDPADDSIPFEITDFEDARHALDEPPPGVGQVPRLDANYWESQRRKALPTDRALSGTAMAWLVGLPPALKPRILAERYPRLANAIAASWSDHQRSATALDDLIADRRGRRRGFPPEVETELQALRRYVAVMVRRSALPR